MTATLRRVDMLRRGLDGGAALVVSGAAFGSFVAPAAAAVPDVDLSYLRLLTAAELLKADFQAQALASGQLDASAARLFRRMRADDKAHYTGLASLLTGAGTGADDRRRHRLLVPARELRLPGLDREARLDSSRR